MSIADIAVIQGSGQNRCMITQNTNWVVPMGVHNIWITACAAGEDGSASDPNYIAKAGEFLLEEYLAVHPGQVIPITVGAGNTVIGDYYTLMAGVLEGEWPNEKLGFRLGIRGGQGGTGWDGGYLEYYVYEWRGTGTNKGGIGGKGGYGGAFGYGGTGGGGGGGAGMTIGIQSNNEYGYGHQASSGTGGGAGGSTKRGEIIVASANAGGGLRCDASVMGFKLEINTSHAFSHINNPGSGGKAPEAYQVIQAINADKNYLDISKYACNLGEDGKDGGVVSGTAVASCRYVSNKWILEWSGNMVPGAPGTGGKGGKALSPIGYGAGGGSCGVKGGGGNGGAGGGPSKGAPGMVLVEW